MTEREETWPPTGEDWLAVGQALRERMAAEGISVAQLARITGQSETTIRYLREPAKRYNKSTLTVISLALGWRHDHLWNILHGEAHKNTESPLETLYEKRLRQMNEFGVLKSAIDTLHDSIHVVAEGIGRLDPAQDPGDGPAEPRQ